MQKFIWLTLGVFCLCSCATEKKEEVPEEDLFPWEEGQKIEFALPGEAEIPDISDKINPYYGTSVETGGYFSGEEKRAGATQVAKHIVKQYLNYPSTADFHLFSTKREEIGYGEYKIGGVLTAKNGFGVEEELVYVVILKYKSGNPLEVTSWTVEDFAMDRNY